MASPRKNLMIDAEQLAALVARRGTSEAAAVREAVETALFAEEFTAAMEGLRATASWHRPSPSGRRRGG